MIFVLSHNDLDGYGCILTALKMNKPLTYINTGYDNIVNSLKNISEDYLSKQSIETLYITDLNFKESDTIELYKIVKHNPSVNVIYIDHHPYENDKQFNIFEKMKQFPNFKMVHNETYCATYLFYQYALRKQLISADDDYDKLMKSINAFDTWKEDDKFFKAGLSLNDVMMDIKPAKFIEILKKDCKINDEMKALMKELHNRKNEYFKRLESEKCIIPFGDTLLFLADTFIAHMTLDYPQYKYYVNGRSYGGISVRFRNLEDPKSVKDGVVNLLSTNPYVFSANGHTNAMGVTLHPEHKDKMLSVVEVLVKHFAQIK